MRSPAGQPPTQTRPVPAAPDDLRTAQLDVTRGRIARAVLDIVIADGAVAVSFPLVAERAGTSLRTVYRHFPNKDLLLAAAAAFGGEAAGVQFPVEERTVGTMARFIPRLWQELHDHIDVIRLQHTTNTGIDLRGRRMIERRAEIVATLTRDEPAIAADDVFLLASLLACLVGSSTMLDLVEQLGLPVDDAARVAAFALTAAVEAARSRGGIPT